MRPGISILILICLQLATIPLCLCETMAGADEKAITFCCPHSASTEEGPGRHEECPDCPHCKLAGTFVFNSPGPAFLPPESLSLDHFAPAPRTLPLSALPSGIPARVISHPWNFPRCSLLENRAYFGVFLI